MSSAGSWRRRTSSQQAAGERSTPARAAVARIPAAKLYPFDARTASGNGFVRQCLPWAPTKPTPLPHGKLHVPTREAAIELLER